MMEPALTVQFTNGWELGSLVTLALKSTFAFTCMEEGTVPVNAMVIGGGGAVVIVTVNEADLVESATEVAVIVTVDPVGTADGAVYLEFVLELPFWVWVGLKEPQAPALPQLADQLTRVFVPFSTSASSKDVSFTDSSDGGVPRIVTETAGGGCVLVAWPLPHPDSSAIIPIPRIRRIALRNVISVLSFCSRRSELADVQVKTGHASFRFTTSRTKIIAKKLRFVSISYTKDASIHLSTK